MTKLKARSPARTAKPVPIIFSDSMLVRRDGPPNDLSEWDSTVDSMASKEYLDLEEALDEILSAVVGKLGAPASEHEELKLFLEDMFLNDEELRKSICGSLRIRRR